MINKSNSLSYDIATQFLDAMYFNSSQDSGNLLIEAFIYYFLPPNGIVRTTLFRKDQKARNSLAFSYNSLLPLYFPLAYSILSAICLANLASARWNSSLAGCGIAFAIIISKVNAPLYPISFKALRNCSQLIVPMYGIR